MAEHPIKANQDSVVDPARKVLHLVNDTLARVLLRYKLKKSCEQELASIQRQVYFELTSDRQTIAEKVEQTREVIKKAVSDFDAKKCNPFHMMDCEMVGAIPCNCGMGVIPANVGGIIWYWQRHSRDKCTLELPDKVCWCGLKRSEHIHGHKGDCPNEVLPEVGTPKPITAEELAPILHADWCKQRRAQGGHGPFEKCTNIRWSGCNGEAGLNTNCATYSRLLTAWEKLDLEDKERFLIQAKQMLSLPGVRMVKS